ncbi:MAG: LCP family protein [Anaerolineales bacterium]
MQSKITMINYNAKKNRSPFTNPPRIKQSVGISYPNSQPPKQNSSIVIPCGILFLLSACLFFMVAFYVLYPIKTTILFLGIDYAPHHSFVGRSDTIVLMRFDSIRPYVGMLSIPRDLWVPIPGQGENRINTAHFFAEANQSGSGPYAAIDTIANNFDVKADYFVRIRFDGVRDIVNAMDGVDIHLDQPLGGYPAGDFHLTGEKALAFARHRAGADDFFRMRQGQLLIKSILLKLINPLNWRYIPSVILTTFSAMDSNMPIWQIPRLGIILLRVGINNIDTQIIDRDMTTPTITGQGASVLLPNWQRINPLIHQMFKYNLLDSLQNNQSK